MKLLRHYVSDVAHMKVRPIAELMCQLRRQPNTCETDLCNFHLLEHLHRELLEAADVDAALLGGRQVAAAHTQV